MRTRGWKLSDILMVYRKFVGVSVPMISLQMDTDGLKEEISMLKVPSTCMCKEKFTGPCLCQRGPAKPIEL